MKVLKYILAVVVTAVLCVFGMQWHYTGRITFDKRNETSIMDTSYYKIKHSIFEAMPDYKGNVVFLGDSLTDYVKFDELLPDVKAVNRGIAGDTTFGVLNRLDEVISRKPSKLFVLIGCNDVFFGVSNDKIIGNIRTIIKRVREGSPETKIYLETVMPTYPDFETNRPNDTINALNVKIKALADETGCKLVDTHSRMAEDGILPLKYTVDGIHLNGSGIVWWVEFLKPFVNE
ncbi:MAG: hypothetical protein IJ587_01040 [Synergistaceae bacterium]|nr:hypothetical protein [Synergistaceae bacterium]